MIIKRIVFRNEVYLKKKIDICNEILKSYKNFGL